MKQIMTSMGGKAGIADQKVQRVARAFELIGNRKPGSGTIIVGHGGPPSTQKPAGMGTGGLGTQFLRGRMWHFHGHLGRPAFVPLAFFRA